MVARIEGCHENSVLHHEMHLSRRGRWYGRRQDRRLLSRDREDAQGSLINFVREALSVLQPSRIRIYRRCSRRNERNRVPAVLVRRDECEVAFFGRLPRVDQMFSVGRKIRATLSVGGGDQG